jgi:uncharacterized membrane protein YbhN (UPF0104 family)
MRRSATPGLPRQINPPQPIGAWSDASPSDDIAGLSQPAGRLMTPRVRQAAGWAIGAGLVLVLLLTLDTATIARLLADANLPLVVIAVTGLTAAHLIGAATWRSLARHLSGLRLTWRSALPLYYAAQAVGGLTPANVGNDTYRVVALRKSGQGTERAAAPIVVQRATSYLALGLLGMAALLGLTRPAGFAPAAGAALVVLAVCAVVLTVFVWRSPAWSFVPDRRAFADGRNRPGLAWSSISWGSGSRSS